MSKKRRDRARANPVSQPVRSAPRSDPAMVARKGNAPPPAASRRLQGWRLWRFRLAAAILLPCLVLLALEAALRLFGFGHPTRFFLPSADGRSFTHNRKFCWQFFDRATATEPHPFLMTGRKPPGTFRIFVLGESAAEGTPDPAFGFARILELMLREQYPQSHFEVVNAAVRGINSHIILPIARECARHEPDLFIIYMGNNEITGLYTPVPGRFNWTPYLTAIRARQWLKSTKTAQLLSQLTERASAKASEPDMPFFRQRRMVMDDPQRLPVYESFRHNLSDVCDAIQSVKAGIILSTMAVNLRDFPPLASLHRPGLAAADSVQWEAAYTNGVSAETTGQFDVAIRQYEKAAGLDDHFADLHFRMARSYIALGQTNQAREHFKLARDWDAMQFRSDSRLNAIIRETASTRSGSGLRFIDAEETFATNAAGGFGLPGAEFFRDHVHFSFDGDYLLASTLLPQVAKSLALGPATIPPPSRGQCAASLAFTHWEEYNVALAMNDQTAHAPFLDQIDHDQRQRTSEAAAANQFNLLTPDVLRQCAKTYSNAIQHSPDDWHLHLNFGGFCASTGQGGLAAGQFESVVAVFPEEPGFRIKLANVLAKEGRQSEAAREIREAFRIDPSYPPAKQAIAWAKRVD